MTVLGEEMLDWLRTKSGVSMVRDVSTRNEGDAIRCEYAGRSWFITLDSTGPYMKMFDPRDVNRRWYPHDND